MSASVDKGRNTDVNYLDFCKAFNMVPHNILAAKLETYWFGDWKCSRSGWVGFWATCSIEKCPCSGGQVGCTRRSL